MTPFHAGELEVQQHAGVSAMAQRVGRGIRAAMSQHIGEYLRYAEKRFPEVLAAPIVWRHLG